MKSNNPTCKLQIVSRLFNGSWRETTIDHVYILNININFNLYQIFLHKPATKVGVVLGVIEDQSSTPIAQVYFVTDIQPQRCTEWNGIEKTCISMLRISNTNLDTVDLEMDHQKIGRIILDSRKFKVVNPWNRSSKYPRSQVKGSTLVETF